MPVDARCGIAGREKKILAVETRLWPATGASRQDKGTERMHSKSAYTNDAIGRCLFRLLATESSGINGAIS
jgi:hypothetical protein